MRVSKMNQKTRIWCSIIAVLAVIGLCFYGILMLQHQGEEGVTDYSEGWKVTFGGYSYQDVNLREFKLPRPVHKNEIMTLEKTIDPHTPPDSVVRILTYLSKVTVSFDGIQMYHYGREDEAIGRMVGSGYHFLRIHQFMQGRNLKIEIMAAEEGAFTNIDPIYLMPEELTLPSYAKDHVWGIYISIFLFMLGVMIMIASLIPADDWENRAKLSTIGAFSLLMGIWNMGSIKLLQMFSSDLATNTGFEYLALFIAPIPLLALITTLHKDEGGWQFYLLRVMSVAMVLFDVIAIVLHLADVAHFCETLTMFHILLAICLVVAIVTAIVRRNKPNRQEYLMNIGMLILFAFGMVDLIRFNLQKYLFANVIWMSESILPLGTLVFIVILVIGYLMHLNDIMSRETEQEMLSHLAYRDSMTGLYNRTSMIEIYEKTIQVDDEISMVLFDVNGLKHTNDTLGHAFGDLLIQCFAKVLEEAFDKIGACARIGGDEFVVLVPSEHNKDIDRALEAFQHLEEQASRDAGFPVRAAYGVASCNEVAQKSLDDVYRLADMRMYGMKQRMKADGISYFRD